jgi:hypothetical protein
MVDMDSRNPRTAGQPRRALRRLAVLLLASGAAFLDGGCKSGSDEKSGAPRFELGGEINPLNLSGDLINFGRRFSAEVSGTASTIAASTKDRKAREMTIQWKLGVIPSMNVLITEPDPRRAFADAWLGCVRQRVVLSGTFGDVFGDQKALAVETARGLEEDIGEIGVKHFGKETFEAARAKAIAYAEENSFREASKGFQQFGAKSSSSGGGDWMKGFFSLPLAPISSLQGVGDTPGAINNFSMTARSLGEMLQGMPERIRWQMELLFFEVDSLDSVVQIREDIDRTSKSIESLARTGEKLPAEVRKELDLALESFTASQEKIRPTLEEARKVLATADQTVQGVQSSAAELSKTAVAFESAARAVDGLLKTYKEIASPPKEAAAGTAGLAPATAPTPTPKAEEKGATPQDYANIAVEFRAAAVELRGLLTELASDKLPNAVSKVGETSNASIDRATGRIGLLIVEGTLGGVVLIAAALGAAIIYRRSRALG